MTRNDTLNREQQILLWKTTGGNYTWSKWAQMHGLPVRNPNFIEEAKKAAAAKPLPVRHGEFHLKGYTAELKEAA